MRRITASLAVVATLALAMAALGPAVLAQDEQDGHHPIVGTWLVDATPQDPADPGELSAFLPGGVLIDASAGAVGAGSWAPTGERSADVTFLTPVTDPQGTSLGFLTIRASIEVAEDGQSFSGTYTLDFPPAAGEPFGIAPGELGPGDVTAERVGVEPMGEPVGPIPDFAELFPPPDEGPAPVDTPPVGASPAPEPSPAG